MSGSSVFHKGLSGAAASLMAVVLSLQCAAAESVAVRVNDRTFSVQTVQKYINETAANMPLTMGQTVQALFGDDPDAFLQAAAEHFVTVAIVQDKLHDKGLDKVSPTEISVLQEYARQTYDQIWESISVALKEAYPNETWTDRAITTTMEQAGYSMDGIYEKALQNLLTDRFASVYCPEITVTDDEVQSFYQEAYVQPDRELYENNVPLFEEKVLFTGTNSSYIPEGYFYIKYITLRPSQQRTAALSDARSTLAASTEEVAAAQAALAQAALTENDLTEPRARYQSAVEAEQTAQAAVAEQERLAEEDYAPMLTLIQSSMQDGESFESLIAKHSVQPAYTDANDPGFPFHPDSLLWQDTVRDKIMALQAYGDCTGPICTDDTVTIYCRMADMLCGDYAPDEETWAEMKNSLLQAKLNQAMDEKVTTWRPDYTIRIDLTGLKFPED